jgi:hypothetical protein
MERVCNETHETVHEPVGKVSVEPRDLDDPGDPSLVPPFRDDSLFLEIVIRDAIPRQADHLGEVVQSVPVYGIAEDEDRSVREPRERLDVLSCDFREPVGGGFARRRVGDPFSAERILLVIVLWGPPSDQSVVAAAKERRGGWVTDEEAGFCVRIAEEVRIDLVAWNTISGVDAMSVHAV